MDQFFERKVIRFLVKKLAIYYLKIGSFFDRNWIYSGVKFVKKTGRNVINFERFVNTLGNAVFCTLSSNMITDCSSKSVYLARPSFRDRVPAQNSGHNPFFIIS